MHEQYMRPLDREGIFEVLRFAPYCRLGVAENNRPYVVPMHYFWRYHDGRVWFLLFSKEYGEKMRCIRRNNKVALEFELVCGNVIKTVVAKGRAIRLIGDLDDLDLGGDGVAIEIPAESITGREFRRFFEREE